MCVTLVDYRRGNLQEVFWIGGKAASEKIRLDEVGDLPRRMGNVIRCCMERIPHARIVAAGLVEIDPEHLERGVKFGHQRIQFDMLMLGDLLLDQHAGAVCADLPEVFECMRQFIDGGHHQVIRGDFRIQRQQILIGNQHLE